MLFFLTTFWVCGEPVSSGCGYSWYAIFITFLHKRHRTFAKLFSRFSSESGCTRFPSWTISAQRMNHFKCNDIQVIKRWSIFLLAGVNEFQCMKCRFCVRTKLKFLSYFDWINSTPLLCYVIATSSIVFPSLLNKNVHFAITDSLININIWTNDLNV